MADSEWVSIGDVLGGGKKPWPPEELAPGVQLRRRRLSPTQKLREAIGRAWIIEPVLTDPRLFYANLAMHIAETDPVPECSKCNDAGYVRYDRSPGDPLFGQVTQCKACFTPRQPVEQPRAAKRKGEPWWSQ